jgi:hypothetical protein
MKQGGSVDLQQADDGVPGKNVTPEFITNERLTEDNSAALKDTKMKRNADQRTHQT